MTRRSKRISKRRSKRRFGDDDDDYDERERKRPKYDDDSIQNLYNVINLPIIGPSNQDIRDFDEEYLQEVGNVRLPRIINKKQWGNVYSGINQIKNQIKNLNELTRNLDYNKQTLDSCIQDYSNDTDPNDVITLPNIGLPNNRVLEDTENEYITADCNKALSKTQNTIRSIQQLAAGIELMCTRFNEKFNDINAKLNPYELSRNPRTIMTTFSRN